MEKYNLDTSTVALDKSLVESQYTKMERDREQYLERARDSAELTIPYLVPDKGSNSATNYPTPYQSVGSRGVMNLASKLMLALFPPQAPFFRLDVDDLIYKKIQGDPQQKQTIEQGLAKIEKAVMDIPLHVTARLSEPTVQMPKLLNMNVGDTMSISVSDGVELLVEGTEIFEGDIGEVAGQSAINLTKRIEQLENEI